MSKSNALGMGFLLDGVDLSGDTATFDTIAGGLAGTQDMTSIDKLAYERQGLLRQANWDLTSFFNSAAGAAHPMYSALPTVDRIGTIYFGSTLGNVAASMVHKQSNYDPTRAQSGELTIKVGLQSNAYGMEWGYQQTAGKRTDTAATNGTGVDWDTLVGAAFPTAFGVQMYVQLVSFSGTSVTVKLQHSDDNASTDPYADITGATSGALSSAPQTIRVATAAINIKRWIRVVTTGTFNPATFHVNVARNLTSVSF